MPNKEGKQNKGKGYDSIKNLRVDELLNNTKMEKEKQR